MVAAVTREILEAQQWKVESCVDGRAAFAKICSYAHYDVLLVDYDVPSVNGLEIVRSVRSMGHRSAMPIVMLSASPVQAAAREAGVDAFLQKPQDIGLLVEMINRLLDKRESI